MAETNSTSRTVRVELPEEAFQTHPWDPERIADELRLLWLLEQVRERRLGSGKAAELAGLPLAKFLQIMGQHRISVFDYDPAELDEELA
jgi:predicted HTH domain antitoxin